MNLTCSYCQTPFTLSMAEIVAALQKMQDENLHHYDAHCPRCGRANAVSRERLEMFTPGWQEAIKETASVSVPASSTVPMTPQPPAPEPTMPEPPALLPKPPAPAPAPMTAPKAPAKRTTARHVKPAAKKSAKPAAKKPVKKAVKAKPKPKKAIKKTAAKKTKRK